MDFGRCFCHLLGRYLFLQTTISTEERRKRVVYLPPLTLTTIPTMKRMIEQAPLILSLQRMFNRPIIWYFLRSYRIILRTILAFTVQMSQKFNAFKSHNSRSESREIRKSTLSYIIILATVYEPYLIFFGRTNILSLLLVYQLLKGLKESSLLDVTGKTTAIYAGCYTASDLNTPSFFIMLLES